mgnify:CR=1 FL=1
MEYINSYTKFYTDVFDKLKVFDILTYKDIEKLYLKVNKILIESGEWNLNDSINKESFKKTLIKTPSGNEKYVYEKGSFSKKYVNSYLNIKPCITGKTIPKESYLNSKFILLSIPKEIINNYQSCSISSDTLDIVREFVRDVEDTCGWEGDWKEVEKIYDIRCGSQKWRSDFSFEWYTSMKKDGIIYPAFFLDEAFLTRGTHRSYLGALAGYDYLFFIKCKSDIFEIISGRRSHNKNRLLGKLKPGYWNNDRLSLNIDVKNKSIVYRLYNQDKIIGKLKL